jgi:hypothetical protein
MSINDSIAEILDALLHRNTGKIRSEIELTVLLKKIAIEDDNFEVYQISTILIEFNTAGLFVGARP